VTRRAKNGKLVVKKKRLRRLDAANLADARGGTDDTYPIIADGVVLGSVFDESHVNRGVSYDPLSLVAGGERRNHNQGLRGWSNHNQRLAV
jgi:hypothetical protein